MSKTIKKVNRYFMIVLSLTLCLSTIMIGQEDDELIVFMKRHRDDPTTEICTISPATSISQCYTDESRRLGGIPLWSPDGQYIALIASDGLIIMNEDGNNMTFVTDFQSDFALNYPVWSPESNAFVFHDIGQDAQYVSIYLIDINGENLSRVNIDHEWHNIEPNWSPDGNFIAFVSILRDEGETTAVNIFSSNVDGSNLVRLTSDHNHYNNPTWSPDGQYIAFTGTEQNSDGIYKDDISLYVMNKDGSNLRRVTELNIHGHHFGWSSDSQRIGFTVLGETIPANTEIYTVDIVTEELYRLTKNEFPDYFGTWSPDGNFIAYSAVPANDLIGWRLFIMDSDGSNIQQLAECGTGVPGCQPDWRGLAEQD